MGIVVEYPKDIAGHDGNPKRLKGERYEVKDEATAAKYHPFAKIVSNADGSPYEPAAEAEAAVESDVKVPAWYTARLEKAEADGRIIPDLIPGEKAYEFDVRAKAAAEAEAANSNTTGNELENEGDAGEDGDNSDSDDSGADQS